MLARFLSGLGKTMISLGVITFLFVAFQLWGTGLEESNAQNELAGQLTSDSAAADQDLGEVAASLGKIDPADTKELPKPEEGESLGIIQFKPNLNKAGIDMRKVFIEGTDKDDLKKGPGHYLGTPFPGQKGNASIAGHRAVSYTHLRAHETPEHLVCRLLLERT